MHRIVMLLSYHLTIKPGPFLRRFPEDRHPPVEPCSKYWLASSAQLDYDLNLYLTYYIAIFIRRNTVEYLMQ